MKFIIVGLYQPELLLNLYNNARSEEKDAKNSEGELSKAKSLIEQTYFDYIDLGAGKRYLGINLSDYEVDTSEYDRHNGVGLGEKVIGQMFGFTLDQIQRGEFRAESLFIAEEAENINRAFVQSYPLYCAKKVSKDKILLEDHNGDPEQSSSTHSWCNIL